MADEDTKKKDETPKPETPAKATKKDETPKPETSAKATKKDKKEKTKAAPEKKGKAAKDYGPDFKYIVRIANADLDGTKRAELALTGIRGVGVRMGTIICDRSGVPRSEPIGNLSDAQIDTLIKTVETVVEHVPAWAVNRPFDVESGQDMHLISSNVDIALRDDLNRLKKIRSYRGMRHENGQKVRGQRSKSNGRTGLTLGVTRSKEQREAQAGKGAEGGKA